MRTVGNRSGLVGTICRPHCMSAHDSFGFLSVELLLKQGGAGIVPYGRLRMPLANHFRPMAAALQAASATPFPTSAARRRSPRDCGVLCGGFSHSRFNSVIQLCLITGLNCPVAGCVSDQIRLRTQRRGHREREFRLNPAKCCPPKRRAQPSRAASSRDTPWPAAKSPGFSSRTTYKTGTHPLQQDRHRAVWKGK